MLVHKFLKLDDCKLKTDGATGTFEGYASRFGGVDSAGDTILAGAFASTLRINGKPKMFFAHDWTMPIGRYLVAKEDDAGLFVQGEFTPDLGLARDVRAAMLHGTIDGLSIGGFVKMEDREAKADGGDLIKKFSRLVEVSPVVFPADGGARVDLASVKGQDFEEAVGDLETIRDFERFLRDAGGLGKGMAAAAIARAKVIFAEEARTKAAAANVDELVARLSRVGGKS